MPFPPITISEVAPALGRDIAADIESRLLQSLRKAQAQSQNTSLLLAAYDVDNHLVGGLTATCSYGWLLIKTLWVDEIHQRSGIGSELMKEADQFALRTSCHGAWLDTSSDKARRFYLALGYEEFGRLDNLPGQFPEDHHRWFLKKPYASPAIAR